MSQQGGQLDLAIHGRSEARPTVHGRAPVHGDHRGSVAAQAQAALQNLLFPAQLQDRREEASAGTVHTHSHFIHHTAASLGAATPTRGSPQARIPIFPSQKTSV